MQTAQSALDILASLPVEPAVWFSRHQPTVEQIDGARALGYLLVAIPDGLALGAISIDDEVDLDLILIHIRGLVSAHSARAVFGVFPTPLLGELEAVDEDTPPASVSCYAAWNVSRTVPGGKPTFTHKSWVYLGHL
jgi:hypothetical protein